ncbi:MAG: alpha/beta hydrolase [Burkholderiaceae bacterium]|nr:alpha/beta hydrolase [Burkholderiaceae bacterium]
MSPRRDPATRRALPWLLGALLLAASALFVRARVQRAVREHPPLGRFIEVDGVRLHLIDAGEPLDDEAVVLLHGNGTMALDFVLAGTVDALSPMRRVIAFDRPGFGFSERPRGRRWTPEAQAALLSKALTQLGVRRAVVLGHSWGTLVAISMALAQPRQVSHLVLASGYYYPTVRADALLLSPPALPIIGTLLRHTLSPLLGRLMWTPIMRRMFGPAPVPPSFAVFPKWLALQPHQLRAAAAESAGMIPAAWRLHGRYAELSMPVTILAGSDDRQVQTALHAERLHRELPGSSLQVVPGQGHMLQHLAPEVVEHALREAAGLLPQPVAAGAAKGFSAAVEGTA